MNSEWMYYQHALIPTLLPHEQCDALRQSARQSLNNSEEGRILFARWTSDYDCGYETNWWYCIKDNPLDLSVLNSKKRYEVNKGIKNFTFSAIDPTKFKDALFAVQVAAFSVYPIAYRPKITPENFSESIKSWNDKKVYGVFYKETNLLCGYAIIEECGKCLKFSVQKTMPEYEKYGVNAALVAGICNIYKQNLQEDFYIVDGERNIKHETHFQDYLEKYFGFRKAYCKLNIMYKWYMKAAVICLYPFRRLLKKLNSHSFINQINAVLKMEEYYRAQKSEKGNA